MARKPRVMSMPSNMLITPIPAMDFGDPEKDPCFGKLYDLTTPECQSCGDIEFCAIATMASHKQKILSMEKETKALDLEIDKGFTRKDIQDTFYKYRERGEGKMMSMKLTAKKFKVKLEYIKEMLK